jgi:hypothetical protein
MASESKSAVRVLPDPRTDGRRSRWADRKPGVNETVNRPAPSRTLAGATILQIVPALREEPAARAAVDGARALLQYGARSLVAGAGGPLVNDLTAAGAEWVSLAADTVNPLRLRANGRAIEQLIGFERVDIVHAHGAGVAWSARAAAARSAVRFVTTLPDMPALAGLNRFYAGAMAHCDRIVAPSAFAAGPLMQRTACP